MGDPQDTQHDPRLPARAAADLQTVEQALREGTLQRGEVAAEMAQDPSAAVLVRLAARARQRGAQRAQAR